MSRKGVAAFRNDGSLGSTLIVKLFDLNDHILKILRVSCSGNKYDKGSYKMKCSGTHECGN